MTQQRQKPDDVVEVLGPAPGDVTFGTWRVRMRDGTIKSLAITNSSSATLTAIIGEYNSNGVFKRLADE